jgi:hypothetical protein
MCDDGTKLIIPCVQPSKNIEDEVVVGDHTTEIAEGVGHALCLMTVVAHREVALYEVVERGVKMKCVHISLLPMNWCSRVSQTWCVMT